LAVFSVRNTFSAIVSWQQNCGRFYT